MDRADSRPDGLEIHDEQDPAHRGVGGGTVRADRKTEEVTDPETGEMLRLTLPTWHLDEPSSDDDEADGPNDDTSARLSHCDSPAGFLIARKLDRERALPALLSAASTPRPDRHDDVAALASVSRPVSPAPLRREPVALCKKQRPTARLWIEREAKIEERSLNFYTDGVKRGSSIEDVRGCAVKASRESFPGRGSWYKITLRRKGHYDQANLPDLDNDGVVRFAFEHEHECQEFAQALRNIAAGRAWDEDSGTPPPLAVAKEGHLEKRGEGGIFGSNEFQLRFMKLNRHGSNTELSYYTARDSSEPNGTVDMSRVTRVERPGAWSWQSSRRDDLYTPYDLAVCEKLDANYLARCNNRDSSKDTVEVDTPNGQRFVDMSDLHQMQQLHQGADIGDGAGHADAGRVVKREDGKEILVTELCANSTPERSGLFGRRWRIWNFRADSTSDAAEWTLALRDAMYAQQFSPICCGTSMELDGQKTPCSIEPTPIDDATRNPAQALAHVVVTPQGQSTGATRRYDLTSFKDVVCDDDRLYGGDFVIKAKLQLHTEQTTSMVDTGADLGVKLRFAKHCEAERDQVLVEIARAAELADKITLGVVHAVPVRSPYSRGGRDIPVVENLLDAEKMTDVWDLDECEKKLSLSEQLQRVSDSLRLSMSGPSELRRSFKRAAVSAGAGKRVGGGATRVAAHHTG